MIQDQTTRINPAFRVTDLINVAYYNFPENYLFEGESHDFWELSYVDRGQVVIQFEENRYLLKSGEMIFCKPNVFHKSWVWQGKTAATVNITFRAQGLTMQDFENKIIVLDERERRCMASVVEEASQTYINFDTVPVADDLKRSNKAPYGSEQIICNNLEELIIYAHRNDRNILVDSRLVSAMPQTGGRSLSSWIKSYLEAHIGEKLTLEKIAKENYISVSKLKRVFRLETGTSVVSYLTALRIKEAKHLISQKKLTFSQIAEKVGFESIHYFSAVFKKETGITPTDYRKLIFKK